MSGPRIGSRVGRFVIYGLLGWCVEVAFTGVRAFERDRDAGLPARTSLWMFPIYGLLQPLFEPAHDAMRGVPLPVRAGVYGLGFMAVEYATGRLLRAAVGEAPWDYSEAQWNIVGLVRLDYFPLWAAAGIGLERVHDALTGVPRPTRSGRSRTRW